MLIAAILLALIVAYLIIYMVASMFLIGARPAKGGQGMDDATIARVMKGKKPEKLQVDQVEKKLSQ